MVHGCAQNEPLEEIKKFIPQKDEIRNAEVISNFLKSLTEDFNSIEYIGKSVVVQGTLIYVEKNFIEIEDKNKILWRIHYKNYCIRRHINHRKENKDHC